MNLPSNQSLFNWNAINNSLQQTKKISRRGKVLQVVGLVVQGIVPGARLGSVVQITPGRQMDPIEAEVVGFKGDVALMMPLKPVQNIKHGSHIQVIKEEATINVGNAYLGRVINGLGLPIDDQGPILEDNTMSLYSEPINPLQRPAISESLSLGIKAIDGLNTIAKGQRVGIMAGSGVGKSVLLGMMARNTSADINVIALIGERGREVLEFVERDLGPEGMARSVVVVATSDSSPVVRMRGAFLATCMAEYFRLQGKDVLLMMDSLTRFAMAQREIGLSIGEPPTTKGYTPSVFALLPKFLERCGTLNLQNGTVASITGLYTVLVDADDMNEPIADAARSILDGHIVLSRDLAHHNHYPAIDILASLSRCMTVVAGEDQKKLAGLTRETMASYSQAEDLINVGAYVKGSNPKIDFSIEKIDAINQFLRQGIFENVGMEQSLQILEHIFAE